MQKCKSFLSLCLLIVLLTACNGKKTASISDFSNQLYTPEYVSGFSIKGADSITTQLFIARGGESAPEGFTGQVLEVGV